MKYAPYEQKILDTFKMFILDDIEFAGGAIPGGPGIISDNVNGIKAFKIPFQFPPKITADGKSATWKLEDKASWEQIAIWQGATSRKISIESKYVIDNYDDSGDSNWTGLKISNIAHLAKAYFYRSIQDGNNDGLVPAVYIQSMYGNVRSSSSWRMTDVSVSHDGSVILDLTSKSNSLKNRIDLGFTSLNLPDTQEIGASQKAYQLETIITYNLESFHTIGGIDPKSKDAQVGKNLKRVAEFNWY